MKTTYVTKTAKSVLLAGLFLCLAFSPRGLGQVADPIDPIIGPLVRILSPANHATFFGPLDIPIFAYKVDAPLATNVEFFAGTNDLGTGFSLGAARTALGPEIPQFVLPEAGVPRLAAEFCLVWTNVPAGSYTLTAVTKGLAGYIPRTSAPVSITVLSPVAPVPATNVVSIVATDPIAVAGTNSWVWRGSPDALPVWTDWPPPVTELFTNWGPKDALFTVRRFGDATDALIISYQIGGTATNGVDYVALPGSVTIPAGEAYALIPIAPIQMSDTNSPKSVVLTLSPDTNSPPNYLVGIPKRAGAVILYNWPRPMPFLLPDRNFHINALGPDGAWFSVSYSADLLNWTNLTTNQVVQGAIDYLDGDASSNSIRFYNVVPQIKAPSQ
jgi:hypothetical protein